MTCPTGNAQTDRAAVWSAGSTPQWYDLGQDLPQVVCQVCDLPAIMDTDNSPGFATFTLTFGPNMVSGEINEIDIASYSITWVDSEDTVINGTVGTVTASG